MRGLLRNTLYLLCVVICAAFLPIVRRLSLLPFLEARSVPTIYRDGTQTYDGCVPG
jgi:hypothetical protein